MSGIVSSVCGKLDMQGDLLEILASSIQSITCSRGWAANLSTQVRILPRAPNNYFSMLTLTDIQLEEKGFQQYTPGRWGKRLRSTTLYYHKVEYFEVPMPQWSFWDWMHTLDIETEKDLSYVERIFWKHIPQVKSNETIWKDKEKL